MKIRLHFLLLFLFAFSKLSAQKYRLLKGKIEHPNLILGGIHVVNISRGATEITDMMGYFEISVAVGEKLLFTGVQYKDRELEITQDLFTSELITIHMDAFVNELAEVVVKPHDLSGRLSDDLKTVPKTLNFSDFGIPGFKGERKEKIISGKSLLLNTLLLPLTGSVNVEAIYKHFSGYYKRLKKKRKLDAEFEAIFSMIKFYGLLFFQENYELEQEQVYDFVLGCAQNNPIIPLYAKNRHQEVIEHFNQYHTDRYSE